MKQFVTIFTHIALIASLGACGTGPDDSLIFEQTTQQTAYRRPKCGNGYCEYGEDCTNCASDCGVCNNGALYLVRVVGETFRMRVVDPAAIAEADALIGKPTKIIIGNLEAGNGNGDNIGWSWHLDPTSIHFGDMAVEVCDGLPSHIENDLDYWLVRVGYYCPWSGEIVKRLE